MSLTDEVRKKDRAVLFVDGNNWHHALVEIGIASGDLDYSALSRKLVTDARDWVETRYYVGEIVQDRTKKSEELFKRQRQFLQGLKEQEIKFFLGRMEKRKTKNALAGDLHAYINDNIRHLPDKVQNDLRRLADNYSDLSYRTEKAVDVMIAVDMVRMAIGDYYDAAYLLSADGDFTPVLEYIQSIGKTAFVASARRGKKLASAVENHRFIRLKREWFDDCRR